MRIEKDPDDIQLIQQLYDSDPEREWERLSRHRMEFAVTLKALEHYLPPAPAAILDCGAGPGRYAIALSARGYDVTLFDLSSQLLKMARQRAEEAGIVLAGLEQGTATDLSRYSDSQFDAVLLMGPLYHLLSESDRRQALSEACRVVRPGSPVFAAFIARYAGHIDAAAHYPERAHAERRLYDRIRETGQLPPTADGATRFVAYFAHPNEVSALCQAANLNVLAVIGLEGLVAGHEDSVNRLTGEPWETWVDMSYEIGHDASIHGGAEHLLAICQRPQWRATLRLIAQTLNREELRYHVVGGASLALRGLPVRVRDLDIEMSKEAIYRFQELYANTTTLEVKWREGEDVRSYFGRFRIQGIEVEVMAELERRIDGRWARSFCTTDDSVDLEGIRIPVLALEEDVLAYLRQGRLDRAALALPSCDPNRLRGLLSAAYAQGLL